jgi:hypothetical protein
VIRAIWSSMEYVILANSITSLPFSIARWIIE